MAPVIVDDVVADDALVEALARRQPTDPKDPAAVALASITAALDPLPVPALPMVAASGRGFAWRRVGMAAAVVLLLGGGIVGAAAADILPNPIQRGVANAFNEIPGVHLPLPGTAAAPTPPTPAASASSDSSAAPPSTPTAVPSFPGETPSQYAAAVTLARAAAVASPKPSPSHPAAPGASSAPVQQTQPTTGQPASQQNAPAGTTPSTDPKPAPAPAPTASSTSAAPPAPVCHVPTAVGCLG